MVQPDRPAREATASGLSEAVVEDYLRHSLHYELDEGDLAGLDLFYRMAAAEDHTAAPGAVDFLALPRRDTSLRFQWQSRSICLIPGRFRTALATAGFRKKPMPVPVFHAQ